MSNSSDNTDLSYIQSEVVKILKTIHNICVRHDISYFCQGGTLLGAIRNKSFIPWDDDGDIMMYRDEYDKLLAVIDSELNSTDYQYLFIDRVPKICMRSNPEIHVDIFLIDFLPNNPILRKYKLIMLKLYQGMFKEHVDLAVYPPKTRILVMTTSLVGRCFSSAAKLKMYERMSRFGNSPDASKCFFSNDLYRFINYEFDRDFFRSLITVEYEGISLYAPKKWEDYLILNYGKDYMTPKKENFYV